MYQATINKLRIYFELSLLYIEDIISFTTSLLAIITPLYYSKNFWPLLPGIVLTLLNYLKIWYQKKKKMKLSCQNSNTLNTMCKKNLINVYDIHGNIIDIGSKENYDLFDLAILNMHAIVNNLIISYDEIDEVLVFYGSQISFESLKCKITEYTLKNNTKNQIKYYAFVNSKKVPKRVFLKPLYEPEFYGIDIFNNINSLITDFLNNRDFYNTTGLPHRIGFCFEGDKGTGKTNLAYAIARNFRLDIIEIDPSHNFDFDSVSFSNCVILQDDGFGLLKAQIRGFNVSSTSNAALICI